MNRIKLLVDFTETLDNIYLITVLAVDFAIDFEDIESEIEKSTSFRGFAIDGDVMQYVATYYDKNELVDEFDKFIENLNSNIDIKDRDIKFEIIKRTYDDVFNISNVETA